MVDTGNCPRCGAHMARPSASTRSCQRCGGYWITTEAAGRRIGDPELADLVGESAESFALAGHRRCPSCRVPMKEISVGDIDVDVCGYCEAVFFDPGELRRLAAARGRSLGPPPPSAEERTEALLETRREDRRRRGWPENVAEFLFDLVVWL